MASCVYSHHADSTCVRPDPSDETAFDVLERPTFETAQRWEWDLPEG